MRKSQEDDIVADERLRGGLGHHPVGQRRQLGLLLAQLLPGTGSCGDRADLDLRMAEQQTEQFSTRVPSGPSHRSPIGHCISMQDLEIICKR